MPDTGCIARQKYQTDVVIIGAGPVGLFSVFECGMVGLSCHVIDSLEAIGGQCSALYPEKPIYDIPAYPEIMAGNLVDQLEKQAAAFSPQFHLNQQAISLKKQSSGWLLKTSVGSEIQAKVVIIAAGAGSFGPNKPPLKGLEEYEGKSVFYVVKRKKDFEGKNIVIAGGGDSAVDWALSLSEIAKNVRLVHRRDKFRAAPKSVSKLNILSKEGKIELVVPAQLHGLIGRDGQLSGVEVIDNEKNVRVLDADILLPFYGLASSLGPVAEWELQLNKNYIEVNPTTGETNIAGIYAIGDIATYKNKLKLILTGFSEAAFAAHHIYKVLNPNNPLHFEYSTTKGVGNK